MPIKKIEKCAKANSSGYRIMWLFGVKISTRALASRQSEIAKVSYIQRKEKKGIRIRMLEFTYKNIGRKF